MGDTTNDSLAKGILEALRGDEATGAPIRNSLFGIGARVALRQQLTELESAFPGFLLEAEEQVSGGGWEVERGTFLGTHQGEWLGIAPARVEVAVPYVLGLRRFEDKYSDAWLLVDHLALLRALGTLPEEENRDYEASIIFDGESHALAERVFATVAGLGFTVREYDLWRNAREDGDPALQYIVSENTLHYGSDAEAQAEAIEEALGQLGPPCSVRTKAGSITWPGVTWHVDPKSLFFLLSKPE